MKKIFNFQFSIFERKGFTLVELLVAIGIFSILVAIGVGGFVHALHTQQEIAALIATQSNASIALEQMARELRTGYLFCNDPSNNGFPNTVCQQQYQCKNSNVSYNGELGWTCNGIDFYNANGQNVDYDALDVAGELERSQSGGAAVPITGAKVTVTYLTFTLFGTTEGDQWPSRITIAMGVAPNSTDPALAGDVLNLETTVSAREIDCTAAGSC